ncbi:MAG: uncharacterized protein H6R26_2859, partial [Proteobacteria bacterium]|nr:uncharacterized protein [Pseudomonadota bacterium]
ALALLALVLISLPFMVEQIRNGVYPQLELAWVPPVPPEPTTAAGSAGIAVEEAPVADAEMAEPAQLQAVPAPRAMLRKEATGSAESGYASERFDEVDPGAVTQTGPGLPQWRWRVVPLGWNGPVLQDQEFGLWLISPGVNMLFNFLRVLLLIGLGFLLAMEIFPRGGTVRRPPPGPRATNSTAALSGALVLVTALTSGVAPEARAEFPGQALLDELKTRLLAPHDCLPECAQISLMRLKLNGAVLQAELETHAQQSVAIPLPALEGQWLPARVTVDGATAEGLRRSGDGALWLQLQPGRHQVTLTGPLPQREQVQIPLPLKPKRVEYTADGWSVGGVGANGVPDAQLQLARMQTSSGSGAGLESRPLPAFLEVERTLQFGLDWHVRTRIQRLSPPDVPITAEIPLLNGESVLTEGVTVRDGKAFVNLVSGQSEASWDSVLEKRPEVVLKAPDTALWIEVWRVDVSPIWHLQSKGIDVAHHQDGRGNWLPEWRPWPGESVSLSLTRPDGAPGNSLTVESSRLQFSPGRRASDAILTLSLRSSQGGQRVVKLPVTATLQSVVIDGQSRPIRQQDRSVTLPIHPGQQTVALTWRENAGVEAIFSLPEIDLGAPSVNSAITLNLPEDRWVLLLGGPQLGPAVLFWGVLGVVLVLAVGLGRAGITPIKSWQWALLLVGLSQVPLAGGIWVVAWLFLLGWRERAGARLDDSRFNVLQLALALWSLIALLFLFYAVEQGLLGLPDMQVSGNNSSAYTLNWYQDHSGDLLPMPWVVSAPLWTYRVIMLAWALWLAYSLLNWLRWGWQCYSAGGIWRLRPKKEVPPPIESGIGKP